jgi:hypothetical protein
MSSTKYHYGFFNNYQEVVDDNLTEMNNQDISQYLTGSIWPYGLYCLIFR